MNLFENQNVNIQIIYTTQIFGLFHVLIIIDIFFNYILGTYYMVKRRSETMLIFYNGTLLTWRRLIPMLLLFDDNKIKMARKPGNI